MHFIHLPPVVRGIRARAKKLRCICDRQQQFVNRTDLDKAFMRLDQLDRANDGTG